MYLPRAGRLIGAVLSSLLVSTLIQVIVLPQAAQAGGPSAPLPDTPQTAIDSPAPKPPRPPDQATTSALSGDQPAGTAPPAGGGTAKATSLSPSATWQVSSHTGDFTWSYPLRVPPAPGGLEPEPALSYASSTVDGRTSVTNNQPSWVGDGWDLGADYIERTYGGCSDDDTGGTIPPKTGDLCWRNDNAMSTGSGMLIAESGNRWRGKSDDGSRIERFENAGNGDNNGEYWRITTVDGVQYFYGSRPESHSTWTVRVYGDDAGEPCHAATFVASHCTQAWRWNLDKVVDPHGNMMLYLYDVETNNYGANLQDAAVSYTRGGVLRRIDYGLRTDGSVAASGQVEFIVGNRCVPGSDCVPSKKNNWPDVPWDAKCDTATCFGNYAPTFWSTKRLAKVVTRVRGASGFTDVDSWTLDHSYPAPGDQEKAALWLKSIVHTGHVGGAVALPAVTFEGTAKPNRVSFSTGVGPLNRYRITGIVSETGGTIGVVYAAADCVEGSSMPANPESNSLRCFPVRWTPPGGNERLEYFHKYVVAEIVESDRYEGTSEQRTTYHYLDGAAWHFDTSEFTKDAKKTWSEFRGFGRVRVRTGNPGDPAGPIGEREQRYYRGMDGDRLPNNGKRSISVTDSKGGSRADSDWLAGIEFETAMLNGVNGAVVETEITTPVVQGPNATRGELKSYLVRPGTSVTHVALAGTAWRTTRVDTRYDDRGQVLEIDDAGDVGTTEDDQCTRNSYARNTDAWIISLGYRVWTVGVPCAATPSDTLGDTRTGYDGLAVGTPPTKGDVTRTEEISESGYVTTSTAVHDVHGRVTSSKDALGFETRTAFTPATGGPVTKTEVTNALGHVTSTTLEPAWGLPTLVVDPNLRRTESAYDALGRTSSVWLANRKRSNGDTASATFTYLIRKDNHTVVTSSRLNALGGYTTSKEIYDSLLRVRQVQAPASGGGRLLTDTRYDSQGRVYFTSQPYFHNSAIDDTLWVASEVDKLGATMTQYDGAGRVVVSAFRGGGTEKWRTTYAHEGDRVHTTPPAGGIRTTTITNARDQVVELHQYNGSTPDITKYAYTKGGELASIVDSMGNAWRYTYDLRGSVRKSEDPDRGVTLMEYDNEQQLTALTDARGNTIRYGYDALGRKTSSTHNGSPLTTWTYDTAGYGKGLPARSTRHAGSASYTTSIGSYSQLNQPVSVTVTIPEHEQTLAGSYTTQLRYDLDGGLASHSMPPIGDLPAEGVVHERDELGLPRVTRGGFNGQTIHYITDTVYTRQGELARIQLGEGTKRAWQSYYYDTHTRRLNRTIFDAEVPAPMQADISYTYDPAGNITSIVDGADAQCFRYDYLRRLTQAWTPAAGCAGDPASLGGPAPYRLGYTYDKVGNRLTDSTRTYSYAAHRLLSVTDGATVDRYEYDQTGNMTARPGQTLEWDVEGRASKVTTADGDSTFVYDADGNRLIRRTPQTTTLYLDGQELTLNRSTGSLTGTRYYTHGGKAVAVRAGGTLSWLGGDHQGTNNIAVDADTMAVKHRRQTPFGAPRGASVDLPGEKGFVGGTEDASTKLVHIGAREYDVALGRFISVDPVMGNEPQLMNAYAYSNNNPVTFSDPTGLYCDSCDYYNHKYGDSSVWTPERKRKSFCDSCEYYSNKHGYKSAWNTAHYSNKHRPTVFKESKKINDRIARERKARAEARRKAEECARSFWCRVGSGIKSVANSVTSFAHKAVKAVTSSAIYQWIGVGMSVAGMFGCAVCAGVGAVMSLVGASVSCAEGEAVGCAAGIASAVLGGVGARLGKVADDIWGAGAGIAAKGNAARGAIVQSGRQAASGHRFTGWAINGAHQVAGAAVAGGHQAVGAVVRGASYVPRVGGLAFEASGIAVSALGAAGAFPKVMV